MERRAAPLLEHDLEQLAQRVAADEERQRLVLVRWPGEQLVEEERRRRGRERGDAEPEPVRRDPRANSRSFAGAETLLPVRYRSSLPSIVAATVRAMPIYEYRCPDGHTFEVFQRFADAPIEKCEVCGKSPVEKVLYPVSVHFKGSGFYSTDYGKGGRKRTPEPPKDGGSSDSGSSEKKSDKDSGAGEKKAAAAD